MNTRFLFAFLAALPLFGCSSITLTRTGPSLPPRAANCDFRVFTAAPGGGYAEIGTIDIKSGGPYTRYKDVADLKENIRPYVCSAGGDAVLAAANGFGWYIQATVLKQIATAGAGDAKTSTEGCKFDTQCKGDRICQQGECVDPTTKL